MRLHPVECEDPYRVPTLGQPTFGPITLMRGQLHGIQ